MPPAEQILIETADGCRLEGDLLHPIGPVHRPDRLCGGIVVAHPHPLYGGNRHHPIVTTLSTTATEEGLVSIRFDFRGTGRSTGSHTGGIGEVADFEAAIESLVSLLPSDAPVVAAGYSFGGAMAMRATHHRITHRVGIAAPLKLLPASLAPTVPTLLLVPRHDNFTTPDEVAAVVASWQVPPVVDVVESADHFLMGLAEDVSERVMVWLRKQTGNVALHR